MKDIHKIAINSDITKEFVDKLFASKIDYDIKRHNALLFITFHCQNNKEVTFINKLYKLIKP